MYETRIFYQDTDAGGVVYYANYLRFCERSWYAWLSSIGIPLDDWEREDVFIMVKKVELDLIDKVRLGETITVTTAARDVGRASFTLFHTFTCLGRVTTRARTQMVCVNREGKLKALPSPFREALLAHVDSVLSGAG